MVEVDDVEKIMELVPVHPRRPGEWLSRWVSRASDVGDSGSQGVPANVRIRTGVSGELRSAFAKIERKNLGGGTVTNESSRALARALGSSTDDAGHAVGKSLGGLGGSTSGNIFPQISGINRGLFSRFERRIAERVRRGDIVFVRVVPIYAPGSTRPIEVLYQARINGKTISEKFPNV